MTIDNLIKLAKDVRVAPALGSSMRLAAGVLELLSIDKPCGWDEDDIASDGPAGRLRVFELVDLTPDEARWVAVQVLRAAERVETA
jgi:hypothetical protein